MVLETEYIMRSKYMYCKKLSNPENVSLQIMYHSTSEAVTLVHFEYIILLHDINHASSFLF